MSILTDFFSNLPDKLIELLYLAPIVLISITFHEYAHALTAYWLGDKTAKEEGRLSLNPIKHIDPIGAIFFLIFKFGWAKPVPVRSLYFKNPKRDFALTAAAGPAMNFILCFIAVPLLAVSFIFKNEIAYTFFYFFIVLNVGFAIFNLIPIAPLDGSRILMLFLPSHIYNRVLQYEQFGFIILILLMFTGVFGTYFGGIIYAVSGVFFTMARFIVGLFI